MIYRRLPAELPGTEPGQRVACLSHSVRGRLDSSRYKWKGALTFEPVLRSTSYKHGRGSSAEDRVAIASSPRGARASPLATADPA